MRTLIFAAALAAIAASSSFAQAPPAPPVNVRGTIAKLDGDTLTVKAREGQDVSVMLAADTPVAGTVKRGLADIKEGDYIASTSTKGEDGKLRALEIHIFSEAQKKTVPQMQVPYDLAPQSIMTNAIVEGVASASQGATFKLTYKDQQTELVVGPDTPIVATAPADRSLLKPGAAVFIVARKQPDGSLAAARITAEKDGVKPPM